MCSLLGQAGNALAGLGSPNLVLPAVLATCPATGKGASLPFKLRHKATQGGTNGLSASGGHSCGSNGGGHNGSHSSGGGDGGGRASLSNGSNSSVCGGLMMMNTGNDSDASSDGSSSMPQQQQQLSSSLEAANAFAEAVQNAAAARENSSPDSELLKTENYALKSELQRLASEVATLKNVLVYSSQSVGQMSALKQQMASVERCASLYRPLSPLGGGGNGGGNGRNGGHHHHHHNSHHSPVHFSDDLVDSKVQMLSNVIQFQKLNDIIV